MARGVYERTELVKRKMHLAAAKNRVVRYHHKATEAQGDVLALTLEVEKLEREKREESPVATPETLQDRTDKTMNE